MRNPFVAMALAAAASIAAFRNQAIQNFNSGNYVPSVRPTSFARKTGMTVAGSKRSATKARNQS